MQNARNSSLDLLKFILSILIVTIHFRPDNYGLYFGYLPSEFSRCAVPAFFIISGYFMTSDNEKSNQWILKISQLYILWSAIYFSYFYFFKKTPLDAYFVLSSIVSGWAHLWYFPALIFSYVIARSLHNKNSSVLFIIIVSLLIIDIYIQYTKTQFVTVNGYRNFIFVGLPFILTGVLIKRHYNNLPRIRYILPSIFILVIFSVIEYRFNYTNGLEYEVPFISIPLSIAIVVFFTKLKINKNALTSFLGSASVAIYLIHIMIIDIIKTHEVSNTYMINVLLIIIVSSCVYFLSNKFLIGRIIFGK
ncbi:TPA: acyltransferase family protein [Escherichia coli]|nr:acyltransferase [Escherichia coli]EEZ6630535.1 acyltransferase [Escherichia coli]HCP3437108.1 acyltransferase family protein [Escherichia coli]